MTSPEDETIDLVITNKLSEQLFAAEQSRYDVLVSAATHPGKRRPRNEDHHAVIRRSRSSEMLFTNLPSDSWSFSSDEAYFLIVADGVGGAAFGDLASQLALQTVLDLAGRATSWVMKYSELEYEAFRARVEAYLEQIQEQFRAHADRDPSLRSMGTTLTAAVLLPPHVLFVQIGDSRAYVYRDGTLQQVTRDQTVAQRMLDDGASPEEARRYGNVLTNSIGGGATDVQAEIIHVELRPNDRMLLCTDGLTDLVADDAIAHILADGRPVGVCEQLIESALDAGGKDNITVVVCDLLASDAGA